MGATQWEHLDPNQSRINEWRVNPTAVASIFWHNRRHQVAHADACRQKPKRKRCRVTENEI